MLLSSEPISDATKVGNMVAKKKKVTRATKKESKVAKKPTEEKSPIVLINIEEAAQYYANHIEISHNPHEFEFLFARLPAKIDAERREQMLQTHRIEIEPSVRVIIPPTLMADIIGVLQTQQEKYQETMRMVEKQDTGDEK